MKNKKFYLFISLLFLVVFLFSTKLVLAGDVLGIDQVDSEIVLKASDPRAIVTRVINVLLGLLAAIAVSLAIYGGFIWMTSGGNEEKISKAKKILKNAVIGLAIILAAWGIVTFIFNKLSSSDQNNQGGISVNDSFFQSGLGAIGACSIESVYPAPKQKAVPRNTMIMATFREEVSLNTVSADSVLICAEDNFDFNDKSCSNPMNFSLTTNDNKLFVFVPDNYLGNENSFTNYIVYFTSDILTQDESKSIFSNCSNDYFLWDFEVSNVLDLTPPKINSIFPQPDNFEDTSSLVEMTFSTASISLLGQPNYFQPASVVSVTSVTGTNSATSTVGATYDGQFTNFNVVIDSSATKAQLYAKTSNGNISLGVFDIVNNEVYFTNYFTLTMSGVSAGNSWDIVLEKVINSSTISVGSLNYYFINTSSTVYGIEIGSDISETAQNIREALSSHPNIEVKMNDFGPIINLKAKVGGSSGNDIYLNTSDDGKFSINSFSGGIDKVENIQINDKKDKPMNSIIQINFNEAINPLTVSGEWSDVQNTIRVRNLNDNSILSGRFSVSSNYKTVEFKSDEKCGINSCGEDIFCLPPNSRLRVELIAAPLFNCDANDTLCANKSPFLSCDNNICSNDDGKFYPLSNIDAGFGIMDAVANSFDGNSDGYSSGPINYYYKNDPIIGTGDNLYWSFWINNQIDTNPPQIISIYPNIDATEIDLWLPIKIGFNKLMMANTLRTGDIIMTGKEGDITHRLINLLSGQLVGYWIGLENIDSEPLDGEPDKTNVYINHAQFYEGSSYVSQVGSGVKDIYQNCFKPSVGLDCSASINSPYCCDGIPSDEPCYNPF